MDQTVELVPQFDSDPTDVERPARRDRWNGLVLSRFPHGIHACVLAAVFLVPVVIRYGAPDAIMLPKLTAIWLLTAGAAGLTGMLLIEGHPHPFRSHITLAVLGFVAALLMATVRSDLPPISLIGLQKRYGGLLPQLAYAAAMLVIFTTYRQRPGLLRHVAWACLAGSSFMSAYLLVQAAGWDWAEWLVNGQPPELPGSTMGNSNFAGGYLAIALPLSLYVAVTCRGRRTKAVVGSLCCLQLAALWLAHSRGGLLALLVSTLVVVFLARSWLPRWSRSAAAGVAAVLAVGALLIVWHPGSSRPPGPLSGVGTSTAANRVAYWQSGWEIFRQDPMLGTGPETFYAFYGRHQRPEQAAKEPLTTVEKPHNIFVERAANTGILGLGSYLLVWVLVLRCGYRRLSGGSSEQRWLLLAFLGSSVAYLVQGFFSIDVPPLAFMGWMMLGAIASLGDVSETAPPPESQVAAPPTGTSNGIRWCAHGLVVIGTVVLVSVGLRPFRADLSASKGRMAEAIRLQPLEARYRAYAGDQARAAASATAVRSEQVEHLREADSFYQEALRHQPDDVNFIVALATLNSVWADAVDPARSQMAELWWRRALAVYPFDPELQLRYAQAVQESTRGG